MKYICDVYVNYLSKIDINVIYSLAKKDIANMLGKKISSGSYGCIYEHIQDQNKVFKVIDMKEHGWYSSLFELDILKRIKHPYILGIVDESEPSFLQNHIHIELPRASYDLYTLIRKNNITLTTDEIDLYTSQLIQALIHFHKCGFVHFDVCEQNVLVFEGHVKLADMSLVRIHKINDKLSIRVEEIDIVCRTELLPAEYMFLYIKENSDLTDTQSIKLHPCMTNDNIDYYAPLTVFDWWALGLLVFYIVTGTNLFSRFDSEMDQLEEMRLYCEDHKTVLEEKFKNVPEEKRKYMQFIEVVLCPDAKKRCRDPQEMLKLLNIYAKTSSETTTTPYIITIPYQKLDICYDTITEKAFRNMVKTLYNVSVLKWKISRVVFITTLDLMCRIHCSVMSNIEELELHDENEKLVLFGYMCLDLSIQLLYNKDIDLIMYLKETNYRITRKDMTYMQRKIRKALGTNVHNLLLTNLLDETKESKEQAVDLILLSDDDNEDSFVYGRLTSADILEKYKKCKN